MDNKFCIIVWSLICITLGFFIGGHRERNRLQTVTTCDTIVRVDTIRLTEFREVERKVTDTMFIKLPASEKSASDDSEPYFADVSKIDAASEKEIANSANSSISAYRDSAENHCSTIVVQDDSLVVALPREEVVIRDSLFTAQISGYKPRLDWIQLTIPTTIERTTSEKTRQSRWSLGISSGIGVVCNESGLHTGVGAVVGVTYRF